VRKVIRFHGLTDTAVLSWIWEDGETIITIRHYPIMAEGKSLRLTQEWSEETGAELSVE